MPGTTTSSSSTGQSTMTMDGKTIRLRASCNACNESKVRCSQRKPECARCERNGIECIYGLSRRTHKDAPPISIPPSQRPRGPSRSSSNGDVNGNGHSKSRTATPPTGNTTPERSAGTHDAGLFGDYLPTAGPQFMIPQQQQNDATRAASQFHMYAPQAPTTTDPVHRSGLLLDFSSLVNSSSGPLMDPLRTPSADYTNPWVLGSLFGGSSGGDGGVGGDMATFWARQMSTTGPMTASSSSSNGECTCHVGVSEMLASIRSGGDDRRMSLDAQLARLKQCIVSSEMSIGCTHGREDAEPIHLMAVATLISYVIDEFEMLASESPLRRSSSMAAELSALGSIAEKGSSLSSGSDDSMTGVVVGTGTANMSLAGLLEPRLSWGVLELEDEEEVEIRQRLYMLSFRKLERLLSQLTLHLRNLHDARASLPDPSRHVAFVMACDYTRLWLERKAEDVKRMFSASTGDDTVDPALIQDTDM